MGFKSLMCFGVWILIAACSKANKNDPPENPAAETVIKTGQTIRVMTYNIHHANPPAKVGVIDMEAIAAVINKEQPDIVFLQEVDVNTTRSGVSLDQAKDLGIRCNMYSYFTKAINYKEGEYGNAILSKFSLFKQGGRILPNVIGFTGESRSLAYVGIKTEDNNMIYFASTHLDESRDDNRLRQIKGLFEINEQLNAPIVLGGDFNARQGSESIDLLQQQFKIGCIEDCPVIIDHITLNKKAESIFKVIKYEIVNDETQASDHNPVISDIKYKE
ncbi:endonuclease/exonuclease/phosphatase family protein [Pseudopedobacter beijingensis]|uniref:Endonuclease/exonuclease/phosphatase family protein n=1 Tax=Pseudopedobacter beijingensis TaxID=1207056 RepID=A0ABW4IBR6_9SPHI